MFRILLTLLVLVASPTIAAQMQERTFPMAPDLLYALVADNCAERETTRMTCDGELFDWEPGGLRPMLKATFLVVPASEGATLRIKVKKSAAAERIFNDVDGTIKHNTAFGNVGRRNAVTPEEVGSAIAFAKGFAAVELTLGTHKIDQEFLGKLEKTESSFGTVASPFVRVVQRALTAAKTYKSLDIASIPPDELQPLTWLIVRPLDLGDYAPAMSRHLDVSAVVLLPAGSKDASQAIQPTWTRVDASDLSNAMGARLQTRGMIAAFPTEALKPGLEIVLVYAGQIEKRVPITERALLGWWLLPEIRKK